MELFDIELKTENNLLKKFEEIHDFIYANEGLSPQQTLNEFLKILFIKIIDENNNSRSFHISSEEYKLLKSGQACHTFNERIMLLFDNTKETYKDIFEEDEKIRLSNKSLGFIVNKLQEVSLTDSSNDAKGLAFQKFLSHKEKDGKGQFFTPEPVVDFCVKIINPQYGETVIDPCCGSGGFIYSAYQHIISNHKECDAKYLIEKWIFGIDINKDIAKIARMKFLLEANVRNNIFCHNSLEDIDVVKLLLSEHSSDTHEGFDVLLTNPPFGTAGKISDTAMLSQYDLGYKWQNKNNAWQKTKTLTNGQPTEILFIERCLQLLKEGGRMAIVLPNGHFENPSLEYLRHYIKQKAQIIGVVNLPQETFIPYGTGVKTSLLFLKKKTIKENNAYSIFFGKVNKLGYQGNKNGTPVYKKTYNGNIVTHDGKPVLDEDFTTIVTDYQSFVKTGNSISDFSFILPFNELIGRMDYDFYSPSNREIFNKISGHTVRLRDIVDVVKAKSSKLKHKDMTVEYIELSDINSYSFEIINSTTCQVHELPSRASFELNEGDIITAIAGNSVGTKKHATAIVTKDYSGAICTNGFRVLRNPRINRYFLLYYLHSPLFLKQMMMYRTGAAIPNVSDNDLMNIQVYLPDDKTIENIGKQVEYSLNLRAESNEIIQKISLNL